MSDSAIFYQPLFVNALGHASGLLLFGLLTVLLLKTWTRTRNRQRVASLIASCLAFLWNLGSLVGLGLLQHNGQVADWLVAVNFSILSLLPPVLFAVVLKHRHPMLAVAGYAIGGISIFLHFAEIPYQSARMHEAALLLMAGGFALLVLIVILRSRSHPVSWTDLVCLLLFTLSFLHFGYGHAETAWTSEITWHHASIPLTLIVLLRDYRLLLVETFIRFVANVGLAGVFTAALYWTIAGGRLIARSQGDGFIAALLVISFGCALILFAHLRTLLQRQLTRTIFGRGDLNQQSMRILQLSAECETEGELLQRAAAEIARFVEAEHFEIAAPASEPGGAAWAELELPLRFSRGDSLALLLGQRQGSRRYLADDIAALNTLASLLIQRVESFRANELQRLANDAEFRALQAQVNPHFLFNALNTLYGTISRESFEARRLVLNLADLFRYSLKRDRTLIPLGEELEIVQAYLEIESLRLRDRLTFEIEATPLARSVRIPVLSVQPLVENAIKHGVAKLSTPGTVRVSAQEFGDLLEISVEDNGVGLDAAVASSGLGLGTENVRQRLRLCYGDASQLELRSTGRGCLARLVLPLNLPAAVSQVSRLNAYLDRG